MFKKLAADALGLSDVGIIVPSSDYDKVDADDYLFHEDGEPSRDAKRRRDWERHSVETNDAPEARRHRGTTRSGKDIVTRDHRHARAAVAAHQLLSS